MQKSATVLHYYQLTSVLSMLTKKKQKKKLEGIEKSSFYNISNTFLYNYTMIKKKNGKN